MNQQALPVSVTSDNGIAFVRIDNPPVNATSTAVRAGLLNAVAEVQSTGASLAILICAGKTFIAGGDMSEFDSSPVAPHLPDVVQAIEDSSVPFITAMHGNVLGGGLEIALGCGAWRIAIDSTKFGMPEVNVGLIPGAGGTQRLPRLVGLKRALDMCANGTPVKADVFADAGGLDKIVSGDLKQSARAFAKTVRERPSKISARAVDTISQDRLTDIRNQIEKYAKGRKAPLLNVDAVLWSLDSFSISQPKERALHLKLRQSAESKALRHAFFAERSVSKPSALQGAPSHNVTKVVIVGGGLMGSGIATAMLNADLHVTLIERDDAACKSAITRVTQNLESAEKRGLMSANQMAERLDRLATTTRYKDASGHDLAVEAVFEDVNTKQEVITSISGIMRDDAILATNTSYLDPQEIFESVSNQSRCIGLHFFSPANIMKLLEVVCLPQTSATTIATSFKLAKSLRKVAVLSGICNGFIGNRMLGAYRRAAEYMLADGALPQDIDQAMRDFGIAMGPFEAQDMSGPQIARANRRRQDATRAPDERYVEISDRLCALQRFGRRSGKSWYRSEDGNSKPHVDSDVTQLIEDYSAELGITRKPYSPHHIQDQLLAVLANVGARIVEEGIAENDAVVDVVKLHGYGFPRWRGGPMHMASELGRTNIQTALAALEDASPNSWIRAERFA